MNIRKNSKPIIIDVEASGFDPMSYPIEIGVVFDNGVRYSTLIKPVKEWVYWDSKAESLHHIQRNTLMQNGKSVFDVAVKLNELLQDKTVYTDGWVVDQPWLDNLFFQANVRRSFFISPLEMILDEKQLECWYEIKNNVIGESDPARHRASSDAWVIQETYARTLALPV